MASRRFWPQQRPRRVETVDCSRQSPSSRVCTQTINTYINTHTAYQHTCISESTCHFLWETYINTQHIFQHTHQHTNQHTYQHTYISESTCHFLWETHIHTQHRNQQRYHWVTHISTHISTHIYLRGYLPLPPGNCQLQSPHWSCRAAGRPEDICALMCVDMREIVWSKCTVASWDIGIGR